MASLKARIEKLETQQPQGLQHLSMEQLKARLAELQSNPEVQAWLADDANNDPLRLRMLANLELIHSFDDYWNE